jgi:uncharacterized membrane protein
MEAKFEDQAPLVIFLTVVFTLLAAAVSAHFLSSEKTRQPVRRIALWVAAGVSTVVAFFASIAFGIPTLQDFRNPNMHFRDVFVGAAIVWAICLCAWIVAIKCIATALRRDCFRVERS